LILIESLHEHMACKKGAAPTVHKGLHQENLGVAGITSGNQTYTR